MISRTHTVRSCRDTFGLLERMVAYTDAGLRCGGSVVVVSRASTLPQLKARWLPLGSGHIEHKQ